EKRLCWSLVVGRERKVFERKKFGKEKVQKIKNCREKEKVVGRKKGYQKKEEKEKVIERNKSSWGKESLLEEGKVVGRKEGYQEGYYQKGCNCQK
ncbi:31877_t:CDS:1, partial [Gigaspora margarita]